MRVVKPQAVSLLTRPFEVQRRFRLGLAVILFVPLGPQRALLGEQGLWKMIAEELPPDQPLDVAMPKPLGEFLVTGRAYAPAGRTVQGTRVRARLGERTKELIVIGDRHLDDGTPSPPTPFAEMPIDWSRAYGGPKFRENPIGRGIAEDPIQGVGFRVRLPNILDPRETPERQLRTPAGFGPSDVTWPQRARLAGTYDDRWLKEDFPGLPRDIDRRFFNVAPYDQHQSLHYTGDEEYSLDNLHPRYPSLSGRLPSIAPRALIERRGAPGAFEEVPLGLTTVWFFPHRLRAVLIHHAEIEVAEEDARDVTCVVLGADHVGALRPPAHFAEVKRRRDDPDKGAIESLRESDLVPADLLTEDAAGGAKKPYENEGLIARNGRRLSEARIEEARAIAASYDLNPDEHAPGKMPPEEAAPTPDTLPATLERLLNETEALQQEQKRRDDADEPAMRKLLEGSGLTYEELQAERNIRPSGPPTYTAEGQREELRGLAADLRAKGGDPWEIEEILADEDMNAMWEASERDQREGYRQTAHIQDSARPMPGAKRRRIRDVAASATTRNWAGSDLCGADFAGLDLSGADLEGAWLDGANLRGTNLSGARLRRAVLAHAIMDNARLDDADLSEANLGRASLRGASLVRAILKDSVLVEADLRQASLDGADIEGASLGDARLAGATLTGLAARGVIFIKGDFARISAAGAVFDDAVFLEADLSETDFSAASLVGASFVKVRARGLRAAGARMRKAVFADGCDLEAAVFTGADLTEANLRATNLVDADLTDAVIDKADFSDGLLAGVRFSHVRAREARFVAADMRRAVLSRGDFAGAALTRADLRGADLDDASFYEADLARVKTDSRTRAERMLQTRMRLLPRAGQT